MDGEPLLDLSILDQLRDWGGVDLKHQMIELFFENAPERVEGVREGLANGDLELAERSAHSLKSSAVNLGAQVVRILSGRIEELPVSIDLLRKPVDRDDLVRILRRNLSRDSGRILVVGDNLDTSARLRRYLREAGLVVYTAEDGDSALAFFRRSEVDLVLLDLFVPGTDEFTAVREIRSQTRDRTLPLVVLTATDLSGEVRDELSQWTSDIILKGPDVEARLRSILDQYFGCSDQEAEGA